MIDNDCIAFALAEVEKDYAKQLLGDLRLRRVDGNPQIERVDTDESDGSVIIYFVIANRSYFLAVQVDSIPEIKLHGISFAASNDCYLVSFSTTLPLEKLRPMTCLIPTDEWSMDNETSSSGLTIQTTMPLANRLDNNLAILLDLLEQDVEGIRQLASHATTFVQVYWRGPTQNLPPIRLNPTILQRLADLSLTLNINLTVS